MNDKKKTMQQSSWFLNSACTSRMLHLRISREPTLGPVESNMSGGRTKKPVWQEWCVSIDLHKWQVKCWRSHGCPDICATNTKRLMLRTNPFIGVLHFRLSSRINDQQQHLLPTQLNGWILTKKMLINVNVRLLRSWETLIMWWWYSKGQQGGGRGGGSEWYDKNHMRRKKMSIGVMWVKMTTTNTTRVTKDKDDGAEYGLLM